MRKRYLSVLSLVLFSTAAAAQPFPFNEQGDMRWACAGVGEDEREAFAKMEAGSSLKLVFAAGKQGQYVAKVDVVLSDREGKRPALKSRRRPAATSSRRRSGTRSAASPPRWPRRPGSRAWWCSAFPKRTDARFRSSRRCTIASFSVKRKKFPRFRPSSF
jgi:hypothetical protein